MMVLFYYNGFTDRSIPYTGTANMIWAMAKGVARKYDVTIAGDYVQRREYVDGVSIVATPTPKQIEEFVAGFDVVVFCNSFVSGRLEKSRFQTWILYHHCWGMHPSEVTDSRRYDLIVALSDVHKDNLKCIGVQTPIRVVPNFVDTDTIRPARVKREAHRVLYAGRYAEHKNTTALIEAMKLLRWRIHDAELHLCGGPHHGQENSEYTQSVRDMIARTEGVVEHGFVSNAKMGRMYSEASVLCHPALIESFGLVIIEAQHCGCIPVVNRECGMVVTLQDEETGFFLDDSSPVAIAKALYDAIQAVDREPGMRQQAKRFVRERFDKTASVKEFMSIIDESK